MFREERDDVLELCDMVQISVNTSKHGTGKEHTAILRSSIELMCLNASIAAIYPHVTKENGREMREGTCKGRRLVVRDSALLELADKSCTEIRPTMAMKG